MCRLLYEIFRFDSYRIYVFCDRRRIKKYYTQNAEVYGEVPSSRSTRYCLAYSFEKAFRKNSPLKKRIKYFLALKNSHTWLDNKLHDNSYILLLMPLHFRFIRLAFYIAEFNLTLSKYFSFSRFLALYFFLWIPFYWKIVFRSFLVLKLYVPNMSSKFSNASFFGK